MGKPLPRLRDHVKGKVNVSHEEILSNLRRNIRRPLPQIHPYTAQPKAKIMLLCGGPSMRDFLAEIKARRRKEWKICALNGAHDWCLDNDILPSCHALLDARAWNRRFVQRPQVGCRYLVASQCDPGVFEALDGFDVHIWHGAQGAEKPILDRYYQKRYVVVGGGSTIGTRAINLLYMLGFRQIAIYGLDSCIQKDRHHAYDQPENDSETVHVLRVGRRKFLAHPWMSSQADELMQMLPTLPDDLNLDFKGDNMVSYILEHTAKRGRVPLIKIVHEGKG